MWHGALMAKTKTRTPEELSAIAELEELTRKYEAAERALDQAREAATEGIVRVLKAKTLGPSDVSRYGPFERQHVGRIAKAAGIPPLRKPTVPTKAERGASAE